MELVRSDQVENIDLGLMANTDFLFESAKPQTVESAAKAACESIAPVWPLENFVAVNPYWGHVGKHFLDVTHEIRFFTHRESLRSLSDFGIEYRRGRILDEDVTDAVRQYAPFLKKLGLEIEDSGRLTQSILRMLKNPSEGLISDLVDLAVKCGSDKLSELDDSTDWTKQVAQEIGKWCSAYFDRGQAQWELPWKGESFFSAWRSAAIHDRTMEVLGIRGFRSFLQSLPAEPAMAFKFLCHSLRLEGDWAEIYFKRLLNSVVGWSSFMRYQMWQKSEVNGFTTEIEQLLLVRLAYDAALVHGSSFGEVFALSFREDLRKAAGNLANSAGRREIFLRSINQLAYEISYKRGLLKKIKPQVGGESGFEPAVQSRKQVQAVFCIDVRSEVYRRQLESVDSGVETLGFAGFFGFAISYHKVASTLEEKQCPVLLRPAYQIEETVVGGSSQGVQTYASELRRTRELETAQKRFKVSAPSCFSFVESFGMASVSDLVSASFAKLGLVFGGKATSGRPVVRPSLDKSVRQMESGQSLEVGLSLEERVALATGALRNMGLVDRFARLVVIAGHGSATVNNPYAAGLDCGACGGNTGEANARIAALVLNDKAVRNKLREAGIKVPEDTVFLPALHNTTTDEVGFFDEDLVPESHREDVRTARIQFDKASAGTRRYRWNRLNPSQPAPQGIALDVSVKGRSLDWSEVRPEWALAGNAAFIAAPRKVTEGVDLEGRSFLHNYDYKVDVDGKTLELIMTAPMVVANWINMQYYASAVDNETFGSGNKVIHNVVGQFGIIQGNGGDLQTGLPIQSIANGEAFYHEPIRLHVVIQAPTKMIDEVIGRHKLVRDLIENEWLQVIARNPDTGAFTRAAPNGAWIPEVV